MGEEILRNKLEKVRMDYNYILIDCPPSLGPIVGAGVLAADSIIVPVPLQQFSVIGLKNLVNFLSVILQRTKSKMVVHILPNMVDARVKVSQTLFDELKQTFAGEILPEIRISAAIPDSQAHQRPLIYYKRQSRGAMDFKRLANYVLKQVNPIRV
jgi:chromosome partitioning protein